MTTYIMLIGRENSAGRFHLFLHNVGIFYEDNQSDHKKDSWPLTAMTAI